MGALKVATTATLPASLDAEARLRIEQVSALTGWGRSKIYGEVKAARFPAPEKRGIRCSRWRSGDVLDWLRTTGNKSTER